MDKEEMTLNETAEEENSEGESSTPEAQATEEAEEPEVESAEDTEEESEETAKDQKKGYSNRVRELNARAKEAEEKAESLASKLKDLTEMPEQKEPDFQPVREPDEPIIKPGEEIDAIELDRRLREREQKILQRADALTTLRTKQSEAVNRINKEADDVLKAYPELDPDNETFNKELSDAITEATEAYVTRSPYSASVKNFVDKMMRPYKGAVSKEVGNMTSEVAKQVSKAAARPTSVREKERPATEKSIAELEAELEYVQA